MKKENIVPPMPDNVDSQLVTWCNVLKRNLNEYLFDIEHNDGAFSIRTVALNEGLQRVMNIQNEMLKILLENTDIDSDSFRSKIKDLDSKIDIADFKSITQYAK